MAFLCDVNFLVALFYAGHRHSERAVAWLEKQDMPGSILVCRVAQMGALRVLTNQAWMKDEVKTPAEFWRAWDGLLNDGRFATVNESPGFEKAWRSLTSRYTRGKMAETDAYLAAFATSGGYGMLTFDREFARFKGIVLAKL